MSLRILMVCQHYWPEQFQITDICEELVRRGHEVTALVGIPNYPTGVVPDEYLDGRSREQERNGVRIVRAEEVPRKPGVIGLARNYWSYMRGADRRLRDLEGRYDVILAYQLSPVLMVEPAMRAKRLFGAPVLLYCADIWPDAVRAMLPDRLSFLAPAVSAVSTWIYRGADAIATNSRAYIDCFERVHGVERSRCRYVPQYADDSYLDMDLSAGSSDKARFMVMGNIGKLQYLRVLMEAVDMLKGRGDFELHVVGTGSAIGELESFVAGHGLEGLVVFHGRRPVEEMPSFYRMPPGSARRCRAGFRVTWRRESPCWRRWTGRRRRSSRSRGAASRCPRPTARGWRLSWPTSLTTGGGTRRAANAAARTSGRISRGAGTWTRWSLCSRRRRKEDRWEPTRSAARH